MSGGAQQQERLASAPHRRRLQIRFVADADPGPDHDFVDTGPVAISAKVRSSRPGALLRCYPLARAGAGRPSGGGRHPEGASACHRHGQRTGAQGSSGCRTCRLQFLRRVASRCKWKHRYYWQSMEMLAFGQRQKPRHSNAARYVDALVELGYVVDIHVPSVAGGRHKRYLTVAARPLTVPARRSKTLPQKRCNSRFAELKKIRTKFQPTTSYEQSSVMGCERDSNT